MINKVILVGNVGKDADIRTLQGGSKVAKFSVATSENFKDKNGEWQKQTEWHSVTAWNSLAEVCEKYVKSGVLVYVEGRIKTESYKDADGVNKSFTQIVCQTLKLLSYADKKEDAARTQEPAPAINVEGDLPF